MLRSVNAQIDKVRQEFRDVEVTTQQGYIQIEIKNFPLPEHWGTEKTALRITLPPGYPQAMPSGFSVQLSGNWKRYCWRPDHWNPVTDNVWKWIQLLRMFFRENHP